MGTLEYWGAESDAIEESRSPYIHLIAGACAGTLEHCGMFPIDTIKTHMQARSGKNGIFQTATFIIRQHGWRGLFRGISAVAAGAVPAHAASFSVYEFFKRYTGASSTSGHHLLSTGFSGIMATIAHDAMLAPVDTLKQKMQLSIRPFKGVFDCFMYTMRYDGGVRALYAGFSTALTMNAPYAAVYFASYESLKRLIHRWRGGTVEQTHHAGVATTLMAGGGAGCCAAALSTPLDVVKTRLQTQSDMKRMYSGMMSVLRCVHQEEGWRGFTRGIGPRVLYNSTSAAIAWCTYEQVKRLLEDR